MLSGVLWLVFELEAIMKSYKDQFQPMDVYHYADDTVLEVRKSNGKARDNLFISLVKSMSLTIDALVKAKHESIRN